MLIRGIAAFLIGAALALGSPVGAWAQAPATVKLCVVNGTTCTPVTSSNPLPISGSFSASIAGFPGSTQTTGTPISVTSSGVTGTLPAGTVVVASNVGATNGAYCKLGASATTSDQLIPPNSWFGFTVGTNTQLTCITATSTTTVNMVGGSGLPTGSGGGGGGGGGGSGAVYGPTAVGSANANPPVVLGGTTTGAAGQNVVGAAIKLGAAAALTSDTSVVVQESPNSFLATYIGAPSTSPCSAYNASCNMNQLLQLIAQTAGNSIAVTVNGTATGATGLTPGTAQTGTIVAQNVDHTSTAGTALGALANYGTSPGAVKVESVNAFITNTPAVALNATPSVANGNGVVIYQGGALSATNGIYSNLLQGNAVLSATNPIFSSVTDGTNKAAVKAASTAPAATDPALVVAISPNGINANGSATSANSAPVVIASDQAAVAVKGNGPAAVSAAAAVTFASQYPTNATTTTPTAVTSTATGTTAATAATLAATASVTNYVCGFDITSDATALAVGTATLSGTISGSLNYLQTISALTTGASVLTRTFNPCIPASGSNVAIAITSAAAGTGGNTIVNIWGYRL